MSNHDLDRPGPSTWAADQSSLARLHDAHNAPSSPQNMASTSSSQGSEVPPTGTSTRLNAVAMLKRAASNREMRGSPAAAAAKNEPPPSASPSLRQVTGQSPVTPTRRDHLNIFASQQALQPDDSFESHQSPLHNENQHLRPSPIPHHLDSRSVSPLSPGLNRSASASRADANRSPLPSLEQLRSRIIHERGLQRSASASAASAAARAYAMSKLTGHYSPRATSPVSDSGGRISEEDEEEEEEEEQDQESRDNFDPSPLHKLSIDDEEATRRRSRRYGRSSQYSRPPSVRSSIHSKIAMRRSRTISGMSQRAEDERKARFSQALEEPEERAGQRKRRMSRIPVRRSTRDDSFDEDTGLPRSPLRDQPPPLPPKSPSKTNQAKRNPVEADPAVDGISSGPPGDGLSRKPSRRELARTEMMRKLSGRRLGGRSPASPAPPHEDQAHIRGQQGMEQQSSSETPPSQSPNKPAQRSSETPSDESSHSITVNVPITNVPPGWFDVMGYDPANRPASDELQKNPDGTFSLPQSAQDAYYAALSSMPNMQLTAEQQVAFMQMQQVLQQQQMQLMGSQNALNQNQGQGDDETAFSSNETDLSPAPVTPEMGSHPAAEPSARNVNGLVTPSTSLSTPGRQQWNSPGAYSDMGANLIPSMHLAPFASQSGQERGLKSDAFSSSEKVIPHRTQLQDWPSTPTDSSAGNGSNGDEDLRQRSRLNSAERRSLQSELHQAQYGSPAIPSGPGIGHSPMPTAADGQTPADTSNAREHGTRLDSPRQFLTAPTPSSFDSSFDRSMSRISGATSTGDGDHFRFDTVLGNSAGAASNTTLPVLPSNTSPGPKSFLTPERALAGKHALAASPQASKDSKSPVHSVGGQSPIPLDKRVSQLKVDTPGDRSGTSADDSLLTPDPPQKTTNRALKDLAISPTLVKEFGDGMEWPGREGVGTPGSETSHVTTPSGSKFIEHFDWQEDSGLASRPNLPRKPSIGPQRSLSSRRKAPPHIGPDEKRQLESGVDPESSVDESFGSTAPSSIPLSPGLRKGNEAGSESSSIAASSTASRPALPGRSSSMRNKNSSGSRSASRQGPPSSLRTISAGSPDRQDAVQSSAAEHESHATQASPSSPRTGSHPRVNQIYKSQHHRMPSASDVETQTAYANNKLTPFPALLAKQNPDSPRASNTPEIAQPRMTSTPQGTSASPSVSFQTSQPRLQRNVSGVSFKERQGNPGDVSTDSTLSGLHSRSEDRSASPSVSLFGSLRRKASSVVRKGSMKKKPSMSGESSPALSANPSPVLSAHLPGRQAMMSPPVQILSPAGATSERPSSPVRTQTRPAEAGGQTLPTGRSRPQTAGTEQTVKLPVHPRIVETSHSRTASQASVASTLQPPETSNGSGGQKAKQVLPVGEESLDAGGAAPNASLLAPLSTSQLEPKTAAMLHRYSQMLTSPNKAQANSPGLPPGLTSDDLASPPRQVVQCSPVFQIVSSSTIKDRFLILFNDVLVIAKPALPPSVAQKRSAGVEHLNDAVLPHIGWTFDVKNVIELRHLTVSLPQEHRARPKPHPLQGIFVNAFAYDPHGAVIDLIRRSGLPNNSSTVARLLAQTPDLDSDVLTEYLCAESRRDVLQAYIGHQRVMGVSIESALRSILMDLRFPKDSVAFEALLMAFASRWVTENKSQIKPNFSERLSADLTFAIMALNDALHGKPIARSESGSDFGDETADADEEELPESIRNYTPPGIFSDPMRTLSKTAFVSAFRSHDPDFVLSDRTLMRIYASVKLDPIQQALSRPEWGNRRPILVNSSALPLKLVYGVPSAPITVSIPEPDEEFALRLYGTDLHFDPPVLSFQKAASRTFTITSRALGTRHAVFIRAGRTARLYTGAGETSEGNAGLTVLPKSITMTVERAFMQHCFTLTTTEPTEQRAVARASAGSASVRRKFMFSVDRPEVQKQWARNLQMAISACVERRNRLRFDLEGKGGVHAVEKAKARRAADALALHVLRQALIPHDSQDSVDSAAASALQRSASVAQAPSQSGAATNHGPVSSQHLRTPSDSRLAFMGNGKPGLGAGSAGGLRARQAALDRNASVSRHYYAPESGAGKEERDLLSPPATHAAGLGALTQQNNSAVNLPLPSETPDDASGDAAGNQVAQSLAAARIARSQTGGIDDARVRGESARAGAGSRQGERGADADAVSKTSTSTMTGNDLITLCRQNSLLPLVLERSGTSTARAQNAI